MAFCTFDSLPKELTVPEVLSRPPPSQFEKSGLPCNPSQNETIDPWSPNCLFFRIRVVHFMKAVFGFLVLLIAFGPARASRTAQEIAQYGFVDIRNVDPTIYVDMMYASDFNFLGEKVHGYKANICYLTRATAYELSRVSTKLRRIGEEQGRELHLLVRDCYRPQKASDQFLAWSKKPDARMKAVFFPELSAENLQDDGYINARSGHGGGSAIDLTIIETRNSEIEPLDMGTIVDFFSPRSATRSAAISRDARENRALLLQLMEPKFVNYQREWWHFTLRDQPHRGKHFDFDVEPANMRVPASLIPAAVENP